MKNRVPLDISLLQKKNFLPNFVDGKNRKFGKTISQKKAPTPGR